MLVAMMQAVAARSIHPAPAFVETLTASLLTSGEGVSWAVFIPVVVVLLLVIACIAAALYFKASRDDKDEKACVTTMEENEEEIYSQFSKLYRFSDSEWRESGRGEAKLLRSPKTGNVRFMLRQEATKKVIANHLVIDSPPYCDLLPASASGGTCFMWTAQDFADDDMKVETLALKFGTTEKADSFKVAFEKSKSKPGKVTISPGPPQALGASGGAGSHEAERRVDPSLDNREVTWQEMRRGLADQQLSESQLLAHWNNLNPAPAQAKKQQSRYMSESSPMSKADSSIPWQQTLSWHSKLSRRVSSANLAPLTLHDMKNQQEVVHDLPLWVRVFGICLAFMAVVCTWETLDHLLVYLFPEPRIQLVVYCITLSASIMLMFACKWLASQVQWVSSATIMFTLCSVIAATSTWGLAEALVRTLVSKPSRMAAWAIGSLVFLAAAIIYVQVTKHNALLDIASCANSLGLWDDEEDGLSVDGSCTP